MDHERQRRSDLRRRLPRQPVPCRDRVRCRRSGAQPAHPVGAGADAAREGRPRLARRVQRELPLHTDTWEIKGHTLELGYSRYFQEAWLADAYVRYYTQSNALFYSDNATSETTYVSRNRQLSTFNNVALGGKVSWLYKKVPGKYEIKLNGAYEFVHFNFKDFTDIRTGNKYAYSASILQLFVTGTF